MKCEASGFDDDISLSNQNILEQEGARDYLVQHQLFFEEEKTGFGLRTPQGLQMSWPQGTSGVQGSPSTQKSGRVAAMDGGQQQNKLSLQQVSEAPPWTESLHLKSFSNRAVF